MDRNDSRAEISSRARGIHWEKLGQRGRQTREPRRQQKMERFFYMWWVFQLPHKLRGGLLLYQPRCFLFWWTSRVHNTEHMSILRLISHAQNPFSTGCDSERTAAGLLGHTQASWDNISGKEKQPSSAGKYFAELTHYQRVAAVTLGFTSTTWDNKSGKEKQPASKYFAELTTCSE